MAAAAVNCLAPSVESANALRRRITKMGSRATTTNLAQRLGVDRAELEQRLDGDPLFAKTRSVWRVATYAPVGSVVRCAYWGYVFRVVSQQPGPLGSDEITVEMLDHERTGDSYRRGTPAFNAECRHVIGSVWSHSTALGDRDEILELPAAER
jgi:hypothetical protein